MPFDIVTRAVLEHHTTYPPATEDAWYGPWNTILTGYYIISPQRRLPDDPQSDIMFPFS